MSVEISYTKAIANYTVKQNATFRQKLKFSLKSALGVITADTITNNDFTVRISTQKDMGTVVKELTLTSGLSFEGTDTLVMLISAADMNFPAAVYYYDVHRTYNDGTVVIRPQGKFTVEADV